MILSRLERSLFSAQRGPFLSPDDGSGGGGGAGAGGESSGGNANSGGTGGSEGQQGEQGAGQEAKVDPVTFVHEGKTYVLQDHANKLIGTARQEGRTTAEVEAKRKADEEAAKAKGDFEKLATDRQAEIDRLQGELSKRDIEALKLSIADKHKLPADLADRLVGDDEAALEEDAKKLFKKLSKMVGAREAPDTEGGAGERGSTGPSDRPVLKNKSKDEEAKLAFTFDGKPLVAWPGR